MISPPPCGNPNAEEAKEAANTSRKTERGSIPVRPKKDVLFLCQFFHPEYISSAQLPFDTAKALQKSGLRVDVLCGCPKEYYRGPQVPKKETVEGIGIQRLPYLQPSRSHVLGRLVNYFSFTLSVLAHLGKLRGYRSIVVYSNPPILPWIVSWAKPLFGCKLVFVSYDLYPELALETGAMRPGSSVTKLMRHINRVAYPRFDRVVALSSEMKRFLAGNRSVSEENIRVIPNWYPDGGEPDRDLTGNRFAETLGNKFVVSYFGNMGTVQDVDTILGAIRLLKEEANIFFLFAGHGNKLETLKQTIAQENLKNAQVLDYLHGKDYRDALQISGAALISLEKGATGLCVPSKTYSYMMEGIPLIAIMGDSDIVADIESGAGVHLENGQCQRLADLVRAMAADPKRCHAMSQKCRELYLERYTPRVCTAQYVDLFRELLGKEAP